MVSADEKTRAARIAQRLASTESQYQEFRIHALQLNAELIERSWLANQVTVLLAATYVSQLIEHPLVQSWSPNGHEGHNSSAYTLWDARVATHANLFTENGFTGCQSSNGCGAVGIVEYSSGLGDDDISLNHPAFKNLGSGFLPSRILSQWNCEAGGCTQLIGTVDPTFATHVNAVAGTFFGSIEGGEDPNVTTLATRRARSGVASDVWATYLRANDCIGLKNAIQKMVALGVKTANMSFGMGCGWSGNATMSTDGGGVNAAIRSATAAGMLVIASSGNGGGGVDYPAIRPEVVSVGGLDSTNSGIFYSGLPIYDQAPEQSSRGTRDVHVGAAVVNVPAVTIVAPENMSGSARLNGPPATYSGALVGTSFSAPFVAGIAALLRDELDRQSWGNPARITQAALLAMGDGFNGTALTSKGTHSTFGAGRILARYPRPQSFGGYAWLWGYHDYYVSQGQEYCWNIGYGDLTGYKHLRLGVVWDEPYPASNAADIDVRIYDVTGTRTLYAYQNDLDLMNRIALEAASLSGRKLQGCVYGYTIPSGQTRHVFASDYLFANPTP